ncbi:hypothetical protein K402DRAFT_198672 [Aulographum hederae CBS 113979]|uniref:Transcription factor domain-containing protein n=1 Tax=Aulographum hederae CBS 113979 TaxID=1176131 RepID=A0A6G1GNL0_9PEZI|nr:hypothetical protein K402DRAFT_198672 [Aulographum hederae CBS 113979]
MCQNQGVTSHGDSGLCTTPPSFQFGTMYSDIATKCAASCIQAAMDLVELVRHNYRSALSGAWWYNGLYASTAGLIFILARLCPQLQNSFNRDQLLSSFARCQDVLDHFASFSISAHNTRSMLRNMDREIGSASGQGQMQHDNSSECASGNSAPAPPTSNLAQSFETFHHVSNSTEAFFGDLSIFPGADIPDDFSAMDTSFFGWDPSLELTMPENLYAVMSAPITPPTWSNSGA